MEEGDEAERKPRSSRGNDVKDRKRPRSSGTSSDIDQSLQQKGKKARDPRKNDTSDSFPGFVDPSEQRTLSKPKKRPPLQQNGDGTQLQNGRRRKRNRGGNVHQMRTRQASLSQGGHEQSAPTEDTTLSTSKKRPPLQQNSDGTHLQRGRRRKKNHPGNEHQRQSRQVSLPQDGHGQSTPTVVTSFSFPIPKALITSAQSACKQTLHWHTIHPHVPIQYEKKLLKILIRSKAKERGMIRNAGDRYKEIATKSTQVGMQLSQALSLRRQHMQHLNPGTRMRSLGLGKEVDINRSAALFESSVRAYMKQCSIRFLTESQQKAKLARGSNTSPPTPDFKLLEPTLLTTTILLQPNQKPQGREFVIHWVEAKMFYGASTIAKGSKSAVGRILSTAEKYVNAYGTGAMVFMYGCGKELAEWLLELGVVALDAHPLDLRPVEKHQRTWCSNKSGLILP